MIWSLISIFGGIFTPVGGGEKGKSYPNWKVEEAKEQVKVVYRSVVEENLSIGESSSWKWCGELSKVRVNVKKERPCGVPLEASQQGKVLKIKRITLKASALNRPSVENDLIDWFAERPLHQQQQQQRLIEEGPEENR